MFSTLKLWLPILVVFQNVVRRTGASGDRPALRRLAEEPRDIVRQVRVARPVIPNAVQAQRLTQSATIILDGMVQAFLARPTFRDDELRCTEEQIETLAKGVMKASARTVLELSAALEPKGAKRLAYAASLDIATCKAPCPLPAISEGLVSIIQLQGALADRCMQGRSLDTFNLAENHLRNLSYVGGAIIANGADIIAELKDALRAFRSGNLHTFGEDIGRAWRKVLLSNVHHLPRSREASQSTSRGLVEGFFINNLQLSHVHAQGALDLHKCINGQNERFFAEVWDVAWLFFEKVTALRPSKTADQQWKAVLGVVLADLPSAMRYCGLDKAQEVSFTHSIKALEKLDFRVDVHKRTVQTPEVSVDLAQAIDNWSHHRWHDFGVDLGKVLQELVLLVFPPVYSRDYAVREATRLEAIRLGASHLILDHVREAARAFQTPLIALLTAGLLVSVAVTSRVMRGITRLRASHCERLPTSDIEGGDDDGADDYDGSISEPANE